MDTDSVRHLPQSSLYELLATDQEIGDFLDEPRRPGSR